MAASKRFKSPVREHCILSFHPLLIGILNYHVMKKRLLSISLRELRVVIIYYTHKEKYMGARRYGISLRVFNSIAHE